MIHHLTEVRWGLDSFGLRLVCPSCDQLANFESLPNCKDIGFGSSDLRLSFRVCPDPRCRAFVMVLVNGRDGTIEDQYPRSLFQLDTTNIPESLTSCLLEAKTCYENNCNRAAAAMLRRAVELICHAKRVPGDNLYERVAHLSDYVVLPPQLLDAMQELRILGNEAAHVEAKVYDDIGVEEVRVGFKLIMEIVKAMYQLDLLVEELRELKGAISDRETD